MKNEKIQKTGEYKMTIEDLQGFVESDTFKPSEPLDLSKIPDISEVPEIGAPYEIDDTPDEIAEFSDGIEIKIAGLEDGYELEPVEPVDQAGTRILAVLLDEYDCIDPNEDLTHYDVSRKEVHFVPYDQEDLRERVFVLFIHLGDFLQNLELHKTIIVPDDMKNFYLATPYYAVQDANDPMRYNGFDLFSRNAFMSAKTWIEFEKAIDAGF